MGARRRPWLYQSTHSRVAYSTAMMERHGPRRWITPDQVRGKLSALNRPLVVSAMALS